MIKTLGRLGQSRQCLREVMGSKGVVFTHLKGVGSFLRRTLLGLFTADTAVLA